MSAAGDVEGTTDSKIVEEMNPETESVDTKQVCTLLSLLLGSDHSLLSCDLVSKV